MFTLKVIHETILCTQNSFEIILQRDKTNGPVLFNVNYLLVLMNFYHGKICFCRHAVAFNYLHFEKNPGEVALKRYTASCVIANYFEDAAVVLCTGFTHF